MSENPSDCWPLSLDREIADFPIGNVPLAEHSQKAGASLAHFHRHAWLDPAEMAAFLASDFLTLVDSQQRPLAWKSTVPDLGSSRVATISFLIRYPWDLLRANELYLARLVSSELLGDVHASAVIEGSVHLGRGSRILPGVFIEGNVVIGANCKIGPNCYLRGHTSIGDSCHIGQSVEIKNSIILSRSHVGHLSYVGDSILGSHVNLGAGTTVSNLRHDGKNHRSMVGGVLVDTGRRKFGTVMGDHVHTGINTSIYPGRKCGPHTQTRPGEIVQNDLLSSSL